MNRRRVSSPPTARARLPLDLSHPFTALDARHATESTTEGLNESTIARANHTECDDFHAEPVHRPPAHVRVARNVRSFTSSPRSSRSSRSVVAVSRARRHSFHSHGVHACTSVDVGGDTRRVTTHQYHFSCLFPPQTIKKKKKFNTRATHRLGVGDTHTSHDPP